MVSFVDSVLIMASCEHDPPPPYVDETPSTYRGNRHFTITLTNFPRLLTRTARYHAPHRSEMTTITCPRTTTQLDALDEDTREAVLYNKLRYEFEQALRSYLEQTEQMYPISLVFDMSDMELPRRFPVE